MFLRNGSVNDLKGYIRNHYILLLALNGTMTCTSSLALHLLAAETALLLSTWKALVFQGEERNDERRKTYQS